MLNDEDARKLAEELVASPSFMRALARALVDNSMFIAALRRRLGR